MLYVFAYISAKRVLFFRKAKQADETVNPYKNSDDGEVNKAFEEDIEQTGL